VGCCAHFMAGSKVRDSGFCDGSDALMNGFSHVHLMTFLFFYFPMCYLMLTLGLFCTCILLGQTLCVSMLMVRGSAWRAVRRDINIAPQL